MIFDVQDQLYKTGNIVHIDGSAKISFLFVLFF